MASEFLPWAMDNIARTLAFAFFKLLLAISLGDQAESRWHVEKKMCFGGPRPDPQIAGF